MDAWSSGTRPGRPRWLPRFTSMGPLPPGVQPPPRRSQPGMGDAPDARRRLRRLVLMILGLDAAVDRPGCPQGDQATAPAPCWRTAMTPPSKSRWDRSAHYQIVVRGELSDRFAHAFPEMTLQPEAGYTRITGVIVDQSHLHGILEGPSQLRHRARQRQRSCRKLAADRAEAGPKSPRITTRVHKHARSTATCGDSRERSGVEVMQRPHLFGVDIELTGGAEGPGSRPDVWRVRAAEHQLRPGRDVVPSFAKIAGRRARRTPAASMPRHSHASPMKGSRFSSE